MIHFVGAGPGAPDLITRRGAALLQEADCIIYAGSLVNPALLGLAKPECAVYNSAEMTLEQVLDVMRRVEAAGGTTVRLHTGDPCLYGAIREQMDALDADDLVRILKEPKNAVLKQYQALFGLDHVQLAFTDDALRAVAEETLKRETGARGLRSVMEELLTKLMFEVPSDPTIEKITITSDTVKKGAQPEIVYNPERKAARLMPQAKAKPQRRKVNA